MKKKAVKKPAKRLTEKDWARIRNEYASSSVSYRKLAEKNGISFNTLKDRASKEHWTEDRKNFRENYAKKTQQNLARRRACASARDLDNLGEAAGNISDGIKALLKDSQQFKRYIITESVGQGFTETNEKIFEKVDTRALRDIAGTMKDLAFVIRDVYGIPKMTEQSAMDIAAKRLLMEQEKLNADEGKNDAALIIHDYTEKKEGSDERAASVAK